MKTLEAPSLAIDYYGLEADATLKDVVLKVRSDEEGHRDENHGMADLLIKTSGEPLANRFETIEAKMRPIRGRPSP